MIREFTKDSLKSLRKDIEIALKSVEEKHGISLKLGGIRFNEQSFTGKLEARIADYSGEPIMAVDFRAKAFAYGLDADLLHKTVVIDGEAYKIVGLKTRNRKYPIIAEKISTGKRFKFTATTVKYAVNGV